MIYFKLLSVYGMRLGTRLIYLFNYLAIDIQLFKHHLLKRLTFSQQNTSVPLLKINSPYMYVSTSGLCVFSAFTDTSVVVRCHWSSSDSWWLYEWMMTTMSIPQHLSKYYTSFILWFILILKSVICVSDFVFFSKLFWQTTWGPMHFHVNIKIS